jgi:hypothetical protein
MKLILWAYRVLRVIRPDPTPVDTSYLELEGNTDLLLTETGDYFLLEG